MIYNPHVNRPYDRGPYASPELPLVGVSRICACTAAVKHEVPTLKLVCSGLSYLRQFSGNLAAGMIAEGNADMAGFGRLSFAYPEFPRELLSKGELTSKRCCVACGKCSELMRAGSMAGCAVHDAEYQEIYRRDVQMEG